MPRGLRVKLLPGVTVNGFSALVLVASAFMPAVRGCREPVYPYDFVARVIAHHPAEPGGYLAALPYVFALVAIAAGVWIVRRGSERFLVRLGWVQSAIVVAVILGLCVEVSDTGWPFGTEAWYHWSWMLGGMTIMFGIASCAWIWCRHPLPFYWVTHLGCVFGAWAWLGYWVVWAAINRGLDDIYYGMYVGIGACVGMLLGVALQWWGYGRYKREIARQRESGAENG